jgi:hypothetical protein
MPNDSQCCHCGSNDVPECAAPACSVFVNVFVNVKCNYYPEESAGAFPTNLLLPSLSLCGRYVRMPCSSRSTPLTMSVSDARLDSSCSCVASAVAASLCDSSCRRTAASSTFAFASWAALSIRS